MINGMVARLLALVVVGLGFVGEAGPCDWVKTAGASLQASLGPSSGPSAGLSAGALGGQAGWTFGDAFPTLLSPGTAKRAKLGKMLKVGKTGRKGVSSKNLGDLVDFIKDWMKYEIFWYIVLTLLVLFVLVVLFAALTSGNSSSEVKSAPDAPPAHSFCTGNGNPARRNRSFSIRPVEVAAHPRPTPSVKMPRVMILILVVAYLPTLPLVLALLIAVANVCVENEGVGFVLASLLGVAVSMVLSVGLHRGKRWAYHVAVYASFLLAAVMVGVSVGIILGNVMMPNGEQISFGFTGVRMVIALMGLAQGILLCLPQTKRWFLMKEEAAAAKKGIGNRQ